MDAERNRIGWQSVQPVYDDSPTPVPRRPCPGQVEPGAASGEELPVAVQYSTV